MRLVIVSNRAPIKIVKRNGSYQYEQSEGGLATGLRSYMEKAELEMGKEILWIGWPGEVVEDEERANREVREKFNVRCVFLSEEVMDKFYQGFCNKTIWPLFHYFPGRTGYEKEFWEQYISVNEIFCKAVLAELRPDDVVWIQDYHLMLLPGMIREKAPAASIGFFLHIPFPSYEVYRMLPSVWRRIFLEGLYGADLIGFHTHEYRTHFLRSTMRIMGLQHHMGEVLYGQRLVKVDSFPMGIDFYKFHDSVKSQIVQNEIAKLRKNRSSLKLILSVDRQDYSKGLVNRLKGYEHFLENNPQWLYRATMMMVVVPSRIGVEDYQIMKSQIDEMVGSINGKFATLEWTPILYQYRSLSFNELSALYNSSDVALVTPLRDGMNLIAKEYIASRTNHKGVLILSEMAGAADELDESIIINPNNIEEIGNSLLQSLEMNEEEQRRRIEIMQKRIMGYDLFRWVEDFMTTLDSAKKKQERLSTQTLREDDRNKIRLKFKRASSRILILDYDGTLVPHVPNPSDAVPGIELLDTLENLLKKEHNIRVVIISGRDKVTLERWFGHLPIDLSAEHGIFLKERGKKWRMIKPVRKSWKKKIIPVINRFVEKLPGSFLEEKEFSVAYHYRKSDPDLALLRVRELLNYLSSFTANMDVQLLYGNKVLEVRNSGIDKGVAAMHWLSKMKKHPRFILAIGDDRTDEDMFRVLPKGAFSIRIGLQSSYAKFNLKNPSEVIGLLKSLSS